VCHCSGATRGAPNRCAVLAQTQTNELAFFENNALFASVSSWLMITALVVVSIVIPNRLPLYALMHMIWVIYFWRTVEYCGNYATCAPKYWCHGEVLSRVEHNVLTNELAIVISFGFGE
jgi:hypothetical protein